MLAVLRRPRTRFPPASPTTSSRLGRWSMARSRSRQRPIPRSSASCAFVPRSWRSTARRRSTPRLLPGSCGRPSEAASPTLTARPLGHAKWWAPTVGVRHPAGCGNRKGCPHAGAHRIVSRCVRLTKHGIRTPRRIRRPLAPWREGRASVPHHGTILRLRAVCPGSERAKLSRDSLTGSVRDWKGT